MNRRKRFVGKLGIKANEQLALGLDMFRLPRFQAREERAVRNTYRKANEIARKIGLEQKTYRRVSSSGAVEEVR
jgi:hypothetical protein